MNKVKIELDEETAIKISALLYNLFIKDFFELTNNHDEYLSFKQMCDIQNLAIDFKSILDLSIEKLYER